MHYFKRYDEDSDTISECRGFSNAQHSIRNGWHTPTSNGHSSINSTHKNSNSSNYSNGSRSSSQTSLGSQHNELSVNGAKSKKHGTLVRKEHVHSMKSSKDCVNGSLDVKISHKRSDSSLPFTSKGKSKSKSSSRQSSTESVTSNNHNGNKQGSLCLFIFIFSEKTYSFKRFYFQNTKIILEIIQEVITNCHPLTVKLEKCLIFLKYFLFSV